MFFHIKMIVKWSISHCTIADYISFCSPFLKMANWAANGLQIGHKTSSFQPIFKDNQHFLASEKQVCYK